MLDSLKISSPQEHPIVFLPFESSLVFPSLHSPRVVSILPSVGGYLEFAAMATSKTSRFFPLLLLVAFLWSTNALPVGTESDEFQTSSVAERGQDILDSQSDDVEAASLSSDESEEPNSDLARSRQRRYVFQTLIVVRSPTSSKHVAIDHLCLSVACGCDMLCASNATMILSKIDCGLENGCTHWKKKDESSPRLSTVESSLSPFFLLMFEHVPLIISPRAKSWAGLLSYLSLSLCRSLDLSIFVDL